MKIEKPPFPIEDFRLLIRIGFPCSCAARRLVRRQDSRGRLLLHEQCPDCGKLFRRQLPHSAAGSVPPDHLPEYDAQRAELQAGELAQACARLRDRFNDARQRKWWADYHLYLESDAWRARSRACISQAGGVCELCQHRPATQSHHKTYERVGNEIPQDLLAVCVTCHRKIHDTERNAGL